MNSRFLFLGKEFLGFSILRVLLFQVVFIPNHNRTISTAPRLETGEDRLASPFTVMQSGVVEVAIKLVSSSGIHSNVVELQPIHFHCYRLESTFPLFRKGVFGVLLF